MKKEELIGKKVKGFKFDGDKYKYGYSDKMDKHIGVVGIIKEYTQVFDAYLVNFENEDWYYPAELIEQHLVDEEPTIETKVVCTNTICQGECGECNHMKVVGGLEPKPTFKPIAMKCNQEQFDEIRPLLESGGCKINDISNFIQYYYLVNNFTNENKVISNVIESMSKDFNRKVYPEWNKKTFLNACGIEWEEPSKEIKEGDYIRGFETKPKSLDFANKYVGVIGRVVSLYESSIAVEFSGGTIVDYPKDQAIEHLCNNDIKELEHPKVLSEDGNELFFDEQGNMIKKVECEEKTRYRFEKGYGLKDYLSDLDNLVDTGWFKNDSVKDCVKYHKDYNLRDFIQKGREYLRQMLVGNEHELPIKPSNIDYGKIEHDPLDDLPIIGDGALMEVSNDKRFWSKAKVICKYKEYYIAIGENSVTVSVWKHIQSIQKTKITRKEFESKFEIID